ncbi:MAG: hypothetical protein ACTSYB_04860 [Candidatus Helarchaeota archaeon]
MSNVRRDPARASYADQFRCNPEGSLSRIRNCAVPRVESVRNAGYAQ